MIHHLRMRAGRRVLRKPLITLTTTLLAGTALATSAFTASAALAGPRPSAGPGQLSASSAPGLTPGLVRLYAMQDRLDAAATRILVAGGAGNASVVVVPRRAQLRVYWHGVVPARVRELAGRLGVHVRFAAAAFTLDYLVDQERRLGGYPGLVQVAPRPDGSGLKVTLAPGNPARDRASLLAASRVPLTITTGTRAEAMFSRQADISPYWGGSAYLNNQTGGQCTNGFALNKVPAVYEISAAHCGSNPNTVTIPGQVNPTGVVVTQDTCRDINQINYRAGGTVAGSIFNGGPNSGVGVPVAGAVSDFVGDLVATGGATTGEHLNATVVAVDLFSAIGGINCKAVGPLTEAVLTDKCLVAPGDSGGPVYSYTTGGGSVNGRGTITAGFGTAVQCQGPNGPVAGFDTVEYAPLMRPAGDPQTGSLQFWNTSLLP
jgi:hypothetical protein